MPIEWTGEPWFQWGLLPLLIFCARVLDVSIGTLRVVFISRNIRLLAAVCGFFEVLIWLLAIGQVMKNLENPACFLAYGFGFASGTYTGIWLDEYFSIGRVVVRIITRVDGRALVRALRDDGFGATVMNAEGANGKVQVIYTTIDRRKQAAVIARILEFNPRAFYTIEDVKTAREGIFPAHGNETGPQSWLATCRKGK